MIHTADAIYTSMEAARVDPQGPSKEVKYKEPSARQIRRGMRNTWEFQNALTQELLDRNLENKKPGRLKSKLIERSLLSRAISGEPVTAEQKRKAKDNETMREQGYINALTARMGKLTEGGLEPDGATLMRIKMEVLDAYEIKKERANAKQKAQEKAQEAQLRQDREAEARKGGENSIYTHVLTTELLKRDNMTGMNEEALKAFYENVMDKAVTEVQKREQTDSPVVDADETNRDTDPTSVRANTKSILEGSHLNTSNGPGKELLDAMVEHSDVAQDILSRLAGQQELIAGANPAEWATAGLSLDPNELINNMIDRITHQAEEDGKPIDKSSPLWTILQLLGQAALLITAGTVKAMQRVND